MTEAYEPQPGARVLRNRTGRYEGRIFDHLTYGTVVREDAEGIWLIKWDDGLSTWERPKEGYIVPLSRVIEAALTAPSVVEPET